MGAEAGEAGSVEREREGEAMGKRERGKEGERSLKRGYSS
jgi:hypothetical protein